jgi:pimeloyl-ACP methyl ester carboxylesterase
LSANTPSKGKDDTMTKYFYNTNNISTNVRDNNLKQQSFRSLLNFLWKYAPGLSKAIVKKMFFSPATYRTRSLEKKYLNEGREFEVSVNGKMIKCWKWGKGPGILLAHGWNGRGIQLQPFIKPLTEAGYTVYAFDAPGHGKSPGKTSSYFEYSDVIRSFFRSHGNLNIQGAIAHSFGAAAVLCGMAKEGYPLETVLIAPALKLDEILTNTFNSYGCPLPIVQTLIQEYEDQFGYNFEEDAPYNLLSHIDSSILVIHDTEDMTVPYADSLEASRNFRNISLHTTRGLGHKKILFDSATIEFVIGHISSKVNSTSSLSHSKSPEETVPQSSFKIMEQYRLADFENRVHLFLECPDLRKDFISIEQSS